MSINAPEREQAQAYLRDVVFRLQARIRANSLTGSEMILGCREILHLWLKGGGATLDDAVIGITGIESQTDHVLGGSYKRFERGSEAEAREVEELGRFFDESFKRVVAELALHLDGR